MGRREVGCLGEGEGECPQGWRMRVCRPVRETWSWRGWDSSPLKAVVIGICLSTKATHLPSSTGKFRGGWGAHKYFLLPIYSERMNSDSDPERLCCLLMPEITQLRDEFLCNYQKSKIQASKRKIHAMLDNTEI